MQLPSFKNIMQLSEDELQSMPALSPCSRYLAAAVPRAARHLLLAPAVCLPCQRVGLSL
jgi:hypothetical protein